VVKVKDTQNQGLGGSDKGQGSGGWSSGTCI
jgi:hypothetical protein